MICHYSHSTIYNYIAIGSTYRLERKRVMVEEKVTVKLKGGLQARPAALFVQEANRFQSTIHLQKNESVVNAKSIMGIMSLAAAHDDELLLKINGPDEQEAFKHLRAYLENEK